METRLLFLISFTMLLFNQSYGQCVSGAAGGNANLIDNMDGTYEIACDGGNVNITGNSSVTASSNITWTSGQTGNFVFTPDCNNLGCQEFTPCVPAGTAIPQQCIPLNTLTDANGNPVALNGTVPAGGSVNVEFEISGICYVSGMTYSGDLGINLGGSGDVSLSVVQPDGVVQGPLTFDIALINGISPVPLSLLNLNVDPNGVWTILVEDAGAGSFTYTIDGNSDICLDATTTAGVQCGDPIEICVVGGCPSFVSVQASETSVCSGGTFNLSAEVDPAGATNVAYMWSGNGINASNQTSPNPMLAVTNTTCAPVNETYNLNLTCTNNGSTIVSNQTVTVTVYPEIDASQVVIDNTTNITDPNCSIAVSYPPCPAFTITGNTTFSPGDNGTAVNYIISNGNAACDVSVTSAVNCIGNCVPANTTVTVSNCDAAGNFTIDVTVNNLGGSSAIDVILSDGSTQPGVTSAGGTYTFGSYASGTSVNIKIIDSNDPSCSVNLGEYTQNCFTCPDLTSVNPLPTNVCGGDMINLSANVNQGVEGTDYAIQWFENGVAIVGGNTANYAHTALAADRCNATVYSYTAELTCLNGGTPSTQTLQNAGPVNVYPVPEINVDFVFQNCSVTPLDNCGNLVINTGGAIDPAPGTSTTLMYSIAVPGAPATCAASGTFTVKCPYCSDYPGNASATESVVCWGESFDISNTSALVSSLGYEVGYVVTPNPPSSYGSTTALLAASLNGTNGAYAAPGSITPDSYTNNGSLFTPTDPCGELVYFTPFLSFACQSYIAENSGGTVETPPGSDFIAGVYQTPGLGGTTLAVPQVPYCNGLVTYNIELCVNDETDDGAGLFGLCFAGEDPLQMNSLFGLINGLPGGGFSNFPNINNIHNSQSNVCYAQNGWSNNPSGELINMVTVNLQDFCAGGNDSDFLSYDFQVNVNCNSSFPTICGDCDVVGAPVAVRFLPPLNAGVTGAEFLCEGDVLNLLDVQFAIDPNANYVITWLDGNGAVIANPATVVPPVGLTSYCYEVSYCDNADCITSACIDVSVDPKPILTAPVLGPVCPGESFDLTSVQGSISIATGGAFTWSVGGMLNSGGAAISNPATVIPIASESYCATFTSNTTGCTNTVCSAFTYKAVPVLLAVAPVVCEGDDLVLSSYNSSITASNGTFIWYNGDPSLGGSTINPTIANYNPATDGTTFWVEFTDSGTGCSQTASITVTANPAPAVAAPSATICEGDALNLTALNSQITTSAGSFTWYDGNPNAGGILVLNPSAVSAVAGDIYCVVFTDGNTSCSNDVCFIPTVNALPNTNNFTPADLCDNAAPYNFASYESQLGTGNFTWYNGNPAAGGTVINTASVTQPIGTTTYWFELSNPVTGCTAISTVDVTVVECCANVDLNIFFDNFPGQTSWDIKDANGNIVASSGGTYSGQAGNSNTTESVCLPDGCYDLNFYDLLNNGMCPFQSSSVGVSTFITPGTLISPGSIVGTLSLVATSGLCGNYNIKDVNGTVLASGGQAFGAMQTNNFCLSGGQAPRAQSAEEEAIKTIKTYDFKIVPTIASDNITVYYSADGEVEIRLIGVDGKVKQQFTREESLLQQVNIDVSDLSVGVNLVQLITKDGVQTQKFVKQ